MMYLQVRRRAPGSSPYGPLARPLAHNPLLYNDMECIVEHGTPTAPFRATAGCAAGPQSG